ncbi:uncharacterized protein EAF01_005443 [Botrytis porri]|uniref:Phosphoribulokinase/uridine kinase domain-containing protein n=1 Tax=Botrytis porri TaxID=87229 RepID=A0A4Z1KH68_9HELO|nr:uncharacterized protein EAF01_005443 [Botrytis porri]KAF7904921.1 hypothetical protein EAF01_005443 [Botrytis porri]TGO84878.1 hypothetical protein BPOR_0455g00040 [Botrytis porri]
MEDQVTRLTEKVWESFQQTAPNSRYLIAISGIPGSGKTTLAATITKRLNALQDAHSNKTSLPPIAGFIPMDGYHLTRAQLSAMPDPAHAHARRGAEFTFDGPAFLSLIQRLREPLTTSTITIHAPSFDHALKDPKANDIPIEPTTRILVFEGNYLSLNKEPWRSAAKLMDQLWFVDVDFEVAKKRLIPRHVKAGIAENEEDAEKRVVENDLVNGEEIVKGRMEVDEVIVSTNDVAWK